MQCPCYFVISSTRLTFTAKPGQTQAPHEHSVADLFISKVYQKTRHPPTHELLPNQSYQAWRHILIQGTPICRPRLRSPKSATSSSVVPQSSWNTYVTVAEVDPRRQQKAHQPCPWLPPHPSALSQSRQMLVLLPSKRLGSPLVSLLMLQPELLASKAQVEASPLATRGSLAAAEICAILQ